MTGHAYFLKQDLRLRPEVKSRSVYNARIVTYFLTDNAETMPEPSPGECVWMVPGTWIDDG